MTKQPLLEKEGTVIAVLRDMRYRVKLDNGFLALAYSAGRLRKRFVKIVVGDRVKLEISPETSPKKDIEFTGRIVYRYNK